MARNNVPSQVLITKGDQSVLGVGLRPEALEVGQIGVFDYHSGLSLDAAGAAKAKNVYLAVGVNYKGGSTLEDIRVSAGQYIDAQQVQAITLKGFTDAKPKIVDITDFPAVCDTDYALKIEFRSQEIYRLFGTNALTKPFVMRTSPCEGNCTYCGDGDANEVVIEIIKNINKDEDNLVKAEYLDYTTTPGTPVVVAPSAVANWIATNVGKKLGIRLTSIPAEPAPVGGGGDIDLGYMSLVGTDIIVSLPEGFQYGTKITTKQQLAYPEGLAKDIKQLEYIAGGFNGAPGPYRQSSVTGMSRGGFKYLTETGVNYNMFVIRGAVISVGGFHEYSNTTETIIAIPCADTSTLTELVDITDALFPQFKPFTDDAATMDCTNVETSDLTEETDGVETLA